MTKITLEQADAIIDGVMTKAAEVGLKPMAVVVLDDGGHTVSYKRQDGSPMMRYETVVGKAYGALGMGMNSRKLEGLYERLPHFGESLMAMSQGKFVPVAGGMLIKNSDGDLLGAAGVSGDTADNDEMACIVGIEAAGLVAE
ncbi:MAG: heme-binding protein [Rhodospirillaceae bacterium]|jgi:uncharacterized protein GlcG (DUF336 family)|nr:heme-binding protein [Rhodospirillaceae bacterium]MBT4588549.1 heme-binding protein [Rhodospirillaceae bacterium]MBT4941401.1 heme-binding protein [Rhodospirillaceae bacterium]MBT7265963.1 heme-binding protein [Rhodospirillaceae bacterium]